MITREDIDGPDPLDEAFKSRGITPDFLVKTRLQALKKITALIRKRKDAVNPKELAQLAKTQDSMISDLHKLMGHYPADKSEHHIIPEGDQKWTIEIVEAKEPKEI